VGVFDNNTALTTLYVDTKRKGLGDGAQKEEQLGNDYMRKVNTRSDISNDGGVAALISPEQPKSMLSFRYESP